ncbi:DUF3237 domain-containing protein [Pseudonocardia sp. TRM90224]|uniref:DUF3237 domain-containing protein n=1 Tax=Pseudonocardia sp. TRM90224 TaxID=2812678 RepID=UPI001E379385|nr:DUF3237 domain-containing protein [Pseudonocardia sp. TRM90224]
MTADPRVRNVAAITTEHLFDIVVDLDPPLRTGGGRTLFGAAGGSFDGPRLRGEVIAGGGDSAVFRPDGTMELDVRLTLRTDAGELISMTYGGRWAVPQQVRADLADPATRHLVDPGRYYFRTTPLFATGAPGCAWLNDAVCVGSGYLVEGGVAYHVVRVL